MGPAPTTTDDISDDPFAAFISIKLNPLSQSVILAPNDAFKELREDIMAIERTNYRDDTDLNKITPEFN